MGDARVASPVMPNINSPIKNPSLEPSHPPLRPSVLVGDAREAAPDGWTDGGGIQEQPGVGGRAAGPSQRARAVLAGIAAAEPQLKLGGKVATHQAERIDDLLNRGWLPGELVDVLGAPIDVVRTTPGGVVRARITEIWDWTPPSLRAATGAFPMQADTTERALARRIHHECPGLPGQPCSNPVPGAGVLCPACSAVELESGPAVPLCEDGCGRVGMVLASGGPVLCGPCRTELRVQAEAHAAVAAFLGSELESQGGRNV